MYTTVLDDEAGIHAHNTLSVENTSVHVFYRFHPLHSATLQVVRRPKRGDGAVAVIDPTGRRLKIPVWMLLQDCADIKITERPHLSKEARLSRRYYRYLTLKATFTITFRRQLLKDARE